MRYHIFENLRTPTGDVVAARLVNYKWELVTDPSEITFLNSYRDGKYTIIPPLKPGEQPRF